MTVIPPIKSQGIKSKLVSWIAQSAHGVQYDRWVEPFMGTGVVCFNIQPKKALLCDSNPHIINFYKAVQDGAVTGPIAREFLHDEGAKLLASDGAHYYDVRKRFNELGAPLDFLFLSRSCFNGMMRFNSKGGFNVPFCKKNNRFAQALITKIVNQIDAVSKVVGRGDYIFRNQDFTATMSEVGDGDLIYCDPPYLGRHVDYFDSWTEEEEIELNSLLLKRAGNFILSTWLKNTYRTNEYVFNIWADCNISTKEHFYHVGASEKNRNAIFEALLTNFPTENTVPIRCFSPSDLVADANSGSTQRTLQAEFAF
jgi:DNA adenine methylase